MTEIEKLNMIAEWQEQHKQLIEDLDNSKKRIEKLEKENAELRKNKEQFIKAKEYIKLLLMNCVGVYESSGKTIAEIQAEAEQFLNSEVEK